MTESHIFQPSWPYFHINNNMNTISSILENVIVDGFRMDHDDDHNTCYPIPALMFDDDSHGLLFSSASAEEEMDPIILQGDCFPITFHHQYHQHLDDHMVDITAEDVLAYFKDYPSTASNADVEISTTPDVSMSLISSDTSLDVTSMLAQEPMLPPHGPHPPLVLPSEAGEIDNELTVFHLLMAYAEAMELGQEELAEVISRRISEKVSPIGDTVERLMYYMFQSSFSSPSSDKQPDYLKQESFKNFHQAFKAFYQIFPHGKFAHFASNLAILEALPKDDGAGIIHIFDFDIGEGIQWASLIEAIGHNHGQREVRLTSVKFPGCEEEGEEEEEEHARPFIKWKFEDTKRRLWDYARSYGLKLKVDEKEWDDDLLNELNNIKPGSSTSLSSSSDGCRREFFVFNCMVGLPHMGRIRSRKDVYDFLQVSQTFLQRHCRGSEWKAKEGIITFGNGDAWEKGGGLRAAAYNNYYTSFLDANMTHYQTLLESIKISFPCHLAEARTALECLFVAPFVSRHAWAEKWAEMKRYGEMEWRFEGAGMEGLSLSWASLMEAKEVVREGESLYGVRIEGESHNEMVMEWRGIPMVKVSCWRS